ncbi:hypothetical protein GCM10010961_03460 [Pseudodonghicola xiamenensis]|uniref:Uncharacterized protein n=1 Tax=Pseudodonghicola xiamenensis TaxID=337702 RepID=A0A8J3MD17_9RHOB|nr:hypothetical protein GCM10010961_03460 [Pseudodonghicola xiamenensis]
MQGEPLVLVRAAGKQECERGPANRNFWYAPAPKADWSVLHCGVLSRPPIFAMKSHDFDIPVTARIGFRARSATYPAPRLAVAIWPSQGHLRPCGL